MAGFYPDVPANRFALHLDGTQAYTKNATNTLTDITASLATLMNDEDNDITSAFRDEVSCILIFPELRDIAAYYYNDDAGGVGTLDVSSNTTNGLDGTWTTIANPYLNSNTNVIPAYRQNIVSLSSGGVKAMRFNFGANSSRDARALHVYGTIPPAQNPDRLIFWEPINNNQTPGAWFDWGDIQQGTSSVKQFRIKNNSAGLTANNVTLQSSTTTFAMSLEFSTDGSNFFPAPDIGNIAPGAISPVLHVRRNVPISEPLQVQACTIRASAGSWT